MDDTLGRLKTTRKTGAERFHENGKEVAFDLLDFWQWSVSDLVSNATRGRLAEYIVARALDLELKGFRDEWAAYDIETPSGIKVEVKSAAYVQSWYQRALSVVRFCVPRTLAWDPKTNVLADEACRQADVHVFALLECQDKAKIDPLDLSQWRFYSLATTTLNARVRSQHFITLKLLEAVAERPVRYSGLSDAVERAAGKPVR